jgi:hypothetical protein
MRAALLLGVLSLVRALPAVAEPACPTTTATLAVLVDNRSVDPSVRIALSGDLLDPSATCSGTGVTSYAGVFTCTGQGLFACTAITNLRPGAWVNRLAVTVNGSDPQVQARRDVLAAGPSTIAATFVVWTVYPKTFLVREATETALRTQLAAAQSHTAAHPGATVMVGFSSAAFPGATVPRTISLAQGDCPADGKPPAAVCLTGSNLLIDALDARAEPGAVVWAVEGRTLSLLRVYGAGNVLRGLVLAGTRTPSPTTQLDTVSLVGGAATGNRLERCRLEGPTMGDALSVELGAGQGDDAATNVVDDCEITGAADKGIKVTTGGRALVHNSCVHDNANGGIQSTFGGHVTAVENVVQHNVPGPAGNGLLVGNNDALLPSTLVTSGNVLRFAGNRGISVTDAADAQLADDYVADNQFAGVKVETTTRGQTTAVPTARIRGLALVCNHRRGISGSCTPQIGDEAAPCGTDVDCCAAEEGCCTSDPTCTSPLRCGAASFPRGFGASQAAAEGHLLPTVDFGAAFDPGWNAFTLNRNAVTGANLRANVTGATVPAEGNQWEHCGENAICNVDAVDLDDVSRPESTTVRLGLPLNSNVGPAALARVSPKRPARGDVVRVFGENFDAIRGTACAAEISPADPCSIDNQAVQDVNRSTTATRIRLLTGSRETLVTLYPDAVTPRMLAFRMPFDCFAPLTLEVAKRVINGDRLTTTISLCDPGGCSGAPAGVTCDDGDDATVDDQCTGGPDGICIGVVPPCPGDCFTGERTEDGGCVPKPPGTACEDGNACTARDRCDDEGVCVSGPPRECRASCMTGVCDPKLGCLASPAGTVCRGQNSFCDRADRCDGISNTCPPDAFEPAATVCEDGDECTLGDHCSGVGINCVAGVGRRSCDDQNACTADACLAGLGCAHAPRSGPCDDGDPCTSDACANGLCIGVPLQGLADAICHIDMPLVDPLCGADPVPDDLRRTLARGVARASRIARHAAERRRPERQARGASRADRALRSLSAVVARAVRVHRITPACADLLDDLVVVRRHALAPYTTAP